MRGERRRVSQKSAGGLSISLPLTRPRPQESLIPPSPRHGCCALVGGSERSMSVMMVPRPPSPPPSPSRTPPPPLCLLSAKGKQFGQGRISVGPIFSFLPTRATSCAGVLRRIHSTLRIAHNAIATTAFKANPLFPVKIAFHRFEHREGE